MLSRVLIPAAPVSIHRWRLVAQPGLGQASFDELADVLNGFVDIGNAKAFVARDADPDRCSMRIREMRRNQADVLECLVDVAFCDQRYARVLRNVIVGMNEILEQPLLEFRVDPETHQASDRDLPTIVEEQEVREGRFYPDVSSRLGIDVDVRSPSSYQSGRRLWLATSRELSPPLVDELTALADQWGSLLMTAFPTDEGALTEGLSMVLNVSGSQHDEVTYEVSVDQFIAAEAAFNPLVNMLALRTRVDVPVIELAIE